MDIFSDLPSRHRHAVIEAVSGYFVTNRHKDCPPHPHGHSQGTGGGSDRSGACDASIWASYDTIEAMTAETPSNAIGAGCHTFEQIDAIGGVPGHECHPSPWRVALRGAALAAGAAAPAAASPLADAALVVLNEAQSMAWAANIAALDAASVLTVGNPDLGQAETAHDDAYQAWSDVVDRMADTPAEGMLGLAIKAAIVERDIEGCRTPSMTAEALLRSLLADIARLAPAVTS
ncbi:hypothetical protein M0638_28230 [Roseomonas sp. NAR14]|uniref:Uncharacterized protein n=1 Tax=Roseomonas acroporae TaxID=2937791 RepID=A0A9X1YG30_9PROT|nr:hypothetical protein [Roseomonas acroporae]MCK8788243.1 hypothetical protein [Roseomonas acroporae]